MSETTLPQAAPGEVAASLLDAITAPTAVLDPDGVIVSVNRAWRMFCLDNGGDPQLCGVGVNYLEVCRRAAATGCADAEVVLAGLVAVLGRETVERTVDYECSSSKVMRWCMLRMTPVDHPGLGALVTHVNVTLRKNLEKDLAERASLDPLTRLRDREQLARWLQAEPGRPDAPEPGDVGVLYIHLDGVQSVSDAFGEAAHDEIVQTLARRLAAVTRPHDGLARLGDHDFAVAAPGMTAPGLAGLVARVRHALGEALLVHGHVVELGGSVGAYLAGPGEDLSNSLRHADDAAYPIRASRTARSGGAAATASDPRDRDAVRGSTPLPPPRQRGLPSGAARPRAGGTPAPVQVRTEADRREPGQLPADPDPALTELMTEMQVRSGELAAARKQLEEFAYSVSHDLRAPLRAMSGFARILVEDHTEVLDAEARHCLDRIQASAEQMGQQIDGLLTISRLQRRRLGQDLLDMTALVRRAWDAVRPDDREVAFEVSELPGARGDGELVTQLLINLLHNAVKFTARAEHPRIAVSAGSVEPAGPTDGTVTYVVEDNGIGFDMRCANRLFSPFQHLHAGDEQRGIGIGLAVARQIVHRHGGTIDATGVPEQGARFRFTLARGEPCVAR